MKRRIIGLVLAGLFSGSALHAQEPPVQVAPIADASLEAILAVIKGEAEPSLLHKVRGPKGHCCLGFGFAADVLAQYTGPDLGTDRPGGHRSQAELDAFAEELIAIALAAPPLDGWGDRGDLVLEDARLAFVNAARTDISHRVPYSKSYDALLRIYEAGRGMPTDLINTDPVRGTRYFLDLAEDRKLSQIQFCQVLRMSSRHGKVIAEDDGTLSFELGGVYSERRMEDVFRTLQGERFVDIDTPGVAPCYWVGGPYRPK